jgi:hypothetical protein
MTLWLLGWDGEILRAGQNGLPDQPAVLEEPVSAAGEHISGSLAVIVSESVPGRHAEQIVRQPGRSSLSEVRSIPPLSLPCPRQSSKVRKPGCQPSSRRERKGQCPRHDSECQGGPHANSTISET